MNDILAKSKRATDIIVSMIGLLLFLIAASWVPFLKKEVSLIILFFAILAGAFAFRYAYVLHKLNKTINQMGTLTQEEILNIFKKSDIKHYVKFGEFDYEISAEEQRVETVIEGELETKNTAYPGDYIVTGAFGERFVLKPEKFAERYRKMENGRAEAIGEGWCSEFAHLPVKFIAPWGEEMICNTGDFLVSPDKELTKVYRIARKAFFKTYREATY